MIEYTAETTNQRLRIREVVEGIVCGDRKAKFLVQLEIGGIPLDEIGLFGDHVFEVILPGVNDHMLR